MRASVEVGGVALLIDAKSDGRTTPTSPVGLSGTALWRWRIIR